VSSNVLQASLHFAANLSRPLILLCPYGRLLALLEIFRPTLKNKSVTNTLADLPVRLGTEKKFYNVVVSSSSTVGRIMSHPSAGYPTEVT